MNLWKPFVYPEEEVVAGGDLVEDEDEDDIVEVSDVPITCVSSCPCVA